MSDMGMGQFAETSDKMANLMKTTGLGSRLFQINEVVKVKGSNFAVDSIAKHTMVLRLIPDDDYQQIPQKK